MNEIYDMWVYDIHICTYIYKHTRSFEKQISLSTFLRYIFHYGKYLRNVESSNGSRENFFRIWKDIISCMIVKLPKFLHSMFMGNCIMCE